MNEIWLALIAFGLLATPAGVICVVWLIRRPAKSRLLPVQRRRKSWWSGGEVVFAFVIFMLAPFGVYAFMDSIGFFDRLYVEQNQRDRESLWVPLLATPFVLAVLLGYLYMISRTRPSHLGLTKARLSQNIVLGCLAFLATTPILFGVLYGLSVFIPPEAHPIEELGAKPLWPVEWGLIVFAATVSAPLLEELAFRGVLLFWMVRASKTGHYTVAAMALAIAAIPTAEEWFEHEYIFLGPLLWIGFLVPFYLIAVQRYDSIKEIPVERWPPNLQWALEASQRVADPEDEHADPQESNLSRRPIILQHENPLAAILGSAILFAAIHGAWPSPVPLFFMGFVLGWLAYRTQSLVAPMVYHALFNGVSVLILILSAFYS